MSKQTLPAVNRVATIRDLLNKSKDQIAMALPKHLSADRMLRIAMTSIQKNPKLLDCDPRTLVASVIECSQLGLEPDDTVGMAYLVPYGRDAKILIGYKGYIELMYRTGKVTSVQSRIVYENDAFDYSHGSGADDNYLRHKPVLSDKGEMIAVYALVRLTSGDSLFEVMPKDEVEAVMNMALSNKANKKDSPWMTHQGEMWRKTPIRRIAKYAPSSQDLLRAVALDEFADAGLDQGFSLEMMDAETATKRKTEDLKEKLKSKRENTPEKEENPGDDGEPTEAEAAYIVLKESLGSVPDDMEDKTKALQNLNKINTELAKNKDILSQEDYNELVGVIQKKFRAFKS